MPISSDTIYYGSFNGKTNFSKHDLFCKIYTKYTYKNCNLKVVEKWTPIVLILDHILQVPHTFLIQKLFVSPHNLYIQTHAAVHF